MLTILGLRVVEDSSLVNKQQNRTHKKKRINKKWAKQYGFTTIPITDSFVKGDTIIMHPTIAALVREELAE